MQSPYGHDSRVLHAILPGVARRPNGHRVPHLVAFYDKPEVWLWINSFPYPQGMVKPAED